MSVPIFQRRLRAVMLAAGVIGVGAACAAQPGAPEPLAGLLACRGIADTAQRLACFDRESAQLAAPAASAASAASSAAVAPGQLLAPTDKFGLSDQAVASREVAAGVRAPEAVKIDAHIAAVAQTADGRFLFTLDNGQVWRQVAADGDMLAKPGDTATVSRGMLGSYWLAFASRRGCKVSRLR